MVSTPLSVFPLGSGQGVGEFQLAPNSALRNGFLYGKTNSGTFDCIVSDFAAGALAAATDWTDITINRQRMPVSMTPAITLLAGNNATETLQFRFWGENLFGEQVFEESPVMSITSTLVTGINAMIFMSKPFAIITRIQYKHSGGLQWSFASVGAVGLWNRDDAASTWLNFANPGMIGRSHIGIELPIKVEPSQSAQIFSQPQILSFCVANYTNPALPFDADNLATLQPTLDEGGSLGGFIIGDKYLNTESITGWAGYHNKVRIVCVPGTKTVRSDSGATTFRFHNAAGAFTPDNIQYFLEARTGYGTAKTFAVPT